MGRKRAKTTKNEEKANENDPHNRIVAASEFESDSPWSTLRIKSVGRLPSKRVSYDWGDDPRRSGSGDRVTGLAIISSGGGQLEYAGGRLEVRSPCYFYLLPETSCVYVPDETGWHERYVTMTGTRVSEWAATGWIPREVSLFPLAGVPLATDLHEQILNGLLRRERTAVERAKLTCERLVFELFAERANQARGAVSDNLQNLVHAWRHNPAGVGNIEDAAASMGLSYAHFRRRFREQFGTTPYQFLLSVKLERACDYLRTSTLPVKQIARACGFSSTESLDRAFRNRTGMSPGRYREQEARWPASGSS